MYIRMFTKTIGIALVVSTISSCIPSFSGDNAFFVSDKHSRVYSVHDRQMISQPELFSRLATADYIMLGEEHGNLIHHHMQRTVLIGLLTQGRKPSVVMEMLNQRDAGLIVSTIRQHPDNPDALAAAVDWENSGWPQWRFYRPLVKVAMDSSLRVAPGNIPGRQLLAMALKGGINNLDPRYVQQVGLNQALPETGEKRLRNILTRAHIKEPSEQIVSALLFAQRMRDASLADAILVNNTGDGVVLIAGKEHSRSDYGVPFYLRYREPSAQTISMVAMTATELKDFQQSSESARMPFEYIWVLSSKKPVKSLVSN